MNYKVRNKSNSIFFLTAKVLENCKRFAHYGCLVLIQTHAKCCLQAKDFALEAAYNYMSRTIWLSLSSSLSHIKRCQLKGVLNTISNEIFFCWYVKNCYKNIPFTNNNNNKKTAITIFIYSKNYRFLTRAAFLTNQYLRT